MLRYLLRMHFNVSIKAQSRIENITRRICRWWYEGETLWAGSISITPFRNFSKLVVWSAIQVSRYAVITPLLFLISITILRVTLQIRRMSRYSFVDSLVHRKPTYFYVSTPAFATLRPAWHLDSVYNENGEFKQGCQASYLYPIIT